MNKVHAILTKRIEFPVKTYLSNILDSKFFSNPGVATVFYLLMSYTVSFVLWLPVAIPVGVLLGTPIQLAKETGVDLPSIFKSSLPLWVLYVFITRGVSILGGSFVPFYLSIKLEQLRKNRLPPNLLKLIILIGTTVSYFYFWYSIRDWWFLN